METIIYKNLIFNDYIVLVSGVLLMIRNLYTIQNDHPNRISNHMYYIGHRM